MDRYRDALIKAVNDGDFSGYCVQTIYFGGGTPSLMENRLADVLNAVYSKCKVADDAEVTLEANPNTVDLNMLKDFYKSGFNRISFGLQAAEKDCLQLLGRTHSFLEGAESVQLAKQAGFSNISVDIMLATPNQTVQSAVNLAKQVVALDVPHISAYLLKVEDNTRFASQNLQEKCPSEDITADIYTRVCDTLKDSGYDHYEISNFARSGFESRHNTAYWKLCDYVGIGASAHSYFKGERFAFADDIQCFVDSQDHWSMTVGNTEGGDVLEFVMLSLRLASGLNLDKLAKDYSQHDTDIIRIKSRAQLLAKQNLLEIDGETIKLTTSGYLLSNSVINYILE